MRHTLLLLAVSTSALIAGCARKADQSFADVAPAATSKVAPGGAAPLTQLAGEALSRGDAAAAIPLAERALESSPGDVDATLVLAQAHLVDGDPVKAADLFGNILTSDKNSVEANTGLGLSLLAQQRVSDARAVLQHAAAQKTNAQAKSNIAFALTLAGAPEDAVKLLDPVALGPDSTPKLRQNFAFALVMANNRARAYEVAGYDLDGVAAARQIATWTDVAQAPFKQRLTQMAGLTVVDASAPALAQAEIKPSTVVAPVMATEKALAPEKMAATDLPQTGVETPAAESTPVEETNVYVAVAEPQQPVVSKPVVLKRKMAPAPVARASYEDQSSETPASKSADLTAVSGEPRSWVVQIGAVVLKSDQSARLEKMLQRRLGRNSGVKVVTVDAGSGTLHRILFGEPTDRAAARNVCASLRGKGRACFTRNVDSLSQPAVYVARAKPVARKAAKPVEMAAAHAPKQVSLALSAPAKGVPAKMATAKPVVLKAPTAKPAAVATASVKSAVPVAKPVKPIAKPVAKPIAKPADSSVKI